jgi:hypothetical protein
MSYRSRLAVEEVEIFTSIEQVSKRPAQAERVFDLPPILHVATIGSYCLFLAIMAMAFMTPELVIPFVIFFVFVGMFFGVPGLWAKVAGHRDGRLPSWDDFRQEGLHIATGRLNSSAVIVQVLTLPVLIVAWGLAIALIAASV